jgi:hypothetical protein
MSWALVRDSGNGQGITSAAFNYTWGNYGGGWYWINNPANAWLYCTATGYNPVNKWTDAYGTMYLYLTRRK